MDPLTTAPLKRGIVRLLRSSSELTTPLKGGINQRTAPRTLKYPYLMYSLVSDPVRTDWGGPDGQRVTLDCLFDISAVALRSVEAENLDMIIANLLSNPTADADLQQYTDGQHVQLCTRVASMPTGPERNALGQRVSQFGGTYHIIVDFPLTDA